MHVPYKVHKGGLIIYVTHGETFYIEWYSQECQNGIHVPCNLESMVQEGASECTMQSVLSDVSIQNLWYSQECQNVPCNVSIQNLWYSQECQNEMHVPYKEYQEMFQIKNLWYNQESQNGINVPCQSMLFSKRNTHFFSILLVLLSCRPEPSVILSSQSALYRPRHCCRSGFVFYFFS